MNPAALKGLEPCVHCGFCLQSCPTYLATSDEADSPRGRIVLMRSMAAGRLSTHDSVLATHLDRCLGCRACEPVCPSGVQYGHAIEDARRVLADVRPIPLPVRFIHAVMAEDRLRRPLLALARLARPLAGKLAGRSRLGFAMGMLAASGPARLGSRGTGRMRSPHEEAPARPPSRQAVLLDGCIMSSLFGHVHEATERVLRLNGFRLLDTVGQGCCGALHAHAGQHEQALALARRNVTAFAKLPADVPIVVNAAGCGAMLKEYGRLLSDDPMGDQATAFSARVRDVSELLATGSSCKGAPLGVTVAYDPPCHLLHAQGIATEPLAIIDAVPGIERVTHCDADVCCGSAGSFTFSQPEISNTVLAQKIDTLRASNPDVIATGNPGCIMQIGAGLRADGDHTPVVHPIELLDWSYAEAGLYDK